MAERQYIQPVDLVEKTIPPEVLEQLKILGRVKFTPKPTTVSAVSTVGSDEDQQTIDDATAASGLIDHVADMEDIAGQIEDMIDDLTKDMAIPVTNDTLRDAVKSLDPNGDGSTITKDVFDKAQAIINHAPIMINGYDPFLTALTGNGTVNGDYLDCDQVTRSIASTWNTPPPNSYSAEQSIKDESSKIADEHEKNLGKMILEILQMFFFNMLWAKYLVDLSIINPTRVMIANPVDSVFCFFKKMCDKPRFSIKPPDCLKEKGPLNKILNKIRCFLMCVPPAKLWDIKKFKPMVSNFNCDCEKFIKRCPPDSKLDSGGEEDKLPAGMERALDTLFPADEEFCVTPSGIIGEADTTQPEGLGIPPQCLKNAQFILEAVVADALSPPDPNNIGIGGGLAPGSLVTNQTATL